MGLSQRNETIMNMVYKKSASKNHLISVEDSVEGKKCKSLGMLFIRSRNMSNWESYNNNSLKSVSIRGVRANEENRRANGARTLVFPAGEIRKHPCSFGASKMRRSLAKGSERWSQERDHEFSRLHPVSHIHIWISEHWKIFCTSLSPLRT